MVKFWLASVKDDQTGGYLDENSFIRLDELIEKQFHEEQGPFDWNMSHEMSRVHTTLPKGQATALSKQIPRDIAVMVLAFQKGTLTEEWLFTRRLPLCRHVKEFMLCPSQRHVAGADGKRVTPGQALISFAAEVADFHKTKSKTTKPETVKHANELIDIVKQAANECKTQAEVATSVALSKRWCGDMYNLSAERCWEMVPLTWRDMFNSDWGHATTIHARNAPWRMDWKTSKYNKQQQGASPTKRQSRADSGVQRKGAASRHDTNNAADIPCDDDTCDIFPCVNSLNKCLAESSEVHWLKEDGEKHAVSPCFGLRALDDVPADTWIASFGPLQWTAKRPVIVNANSALAKNGFSMYFTKKPTPLAYTSGWGTQKKGWRGRYWAPPCTFHTFHCNTTFVPDEEAETFNVKTIRELTMTSIWPTTWRDIIETAMC
jgi:hypothetical protein